MAIYLFQCKKCGSEKELYKKSAPHNVKCKCGEKMDRIYTGVAVNFKGNGWTPKYH